MDVTTPITANGDAEHRPHPRSRRRLGGRLNGRRRGLPRRGERGSITAEFAVALPAAIVLLFAGIAAISAITTQMRCGDAAREAALAASRGEDGEAAALRHAPSDANVRIFIDAGTVHAEVTAQAPILGDVLPPITVGGDAVAALEPGGSP